MPEKHASWEQILDWIESPDRLKTAVQAHITTCPRCSQLATEVRQLLSSLANARLPNPPEALRAQ
ncbi:MAG: hypothetical protein GF330_05095, partial [Candidatus Eisenbacteria bacterium]|nr:hypothetical protein [Candidatus Eisenbacteria bacterium]